MRRVVRTGAVLPFIFTGMYMKYIFLTPCVIFHDMVLVWYWGESWPRPDPKIEDYGRLYAIRYWIYSHLPRICEGFRRGEKIRIPDFSFFAVQINLSRSTAVRSQHLYPKKKKIRKLSVRAKSRKWFNEVREQIKITYTAIKSLRIQCVLSKQNLWQFVLK